MKFASRLPVKSERKSYPEEISLLGWSTTEWKLSFAKNTMSWYSTEGLGTLYTNTLSLTRPFLSAKAHRELRIHKGVFESFSTLHGNALTQIWRKVYFPDVCTILSSVTAVLLSSLCRG